MASNKIQRINEDIQRELSELLRNIKDPRLQQGMISITGVETTGDLRYTKIYISVLGSFDEKELTKGLKSASGYLRRELGNRLNLRYTPEPIFELDPSLARGAHISKLLNELEKNSGSSENEETDDN